MEPNEQNEQEVQPVKKDKKEKPKYTWQQNVALWLHDMVYMLVGVMILLMLIFRIIIVDGPSMQNTLLNGDYMLLLGNTFCQEYEYGDVVVISEHTYSNGKPIVKRVIATEGQTVRIDNRTNEVSVDGKVLDEPYISTATKFYASGDDAVYEDGGAVRVWTVEEGRVFVMGDNRGNSKDSRFSDIGQVDTRELLGKVKFILFPGTGVAKDPRPRDFNRIGAVK